MAVVGLVFYVGTALLERVSPTSWVRAYQRLANRVQRPLMRVLPGWCVVETRGRRTGLARQNPVGCRFSGRTVWIVAGDGVRSSFVQNLQAEPRVRVQHLGRWHAGTAQVVPEDDPRRRLLRMNPVNSLFVLLASRSEHRCTVRVDLDPADGAAEGSAQP